MADKAKLLELAERVEQAEGPDRNLDAMIHHAVKNGVGTGYAADAPSFTASLDAAMTLVPAKPFPELRPGEWWWMVDSLGCAAHVAYENRDSAIPEYSSTAATPALALTAAALRSHAAMIEDHPHE